MDQGTPMHTVTLWLVRHAQPLIDAGLCYGQTDVPADAQATETAAMAVAQAWHNGGHPQPPLIWTSPLQRTQALARALQQRLGGATPKPEPRLMELDFGLWEGVAWSQLSPADFDGWTQDFDRHPVGQGESLAQLRTRVQAAWQDTWQHTLAAGHTNAVWVTHAGVIRTMQLLAQGLPPPWQAADWPRTTPDFGQWLTLSLQVPSLSSAEAPT